MEFLAFKIRDAETGKVGAFSRLPLRALQEEPRRQCTVLAILFNYQRRALCVQVYFEVAKPEPDGPGIDYTLLDDSVRFIQYQFPNEVLSLNNIGTTCATRRRSRKLPSL